MQATLNPTIPAPNSVRGPQPVQRNIAVDAYRGFVMLLMMAEVLELARVAQAFPGNWFWGFLGYNQTHVEWAGCSLHDMIQPSFSFLVGVALPYSIASRLAKGGTFGKMWAHAIWRSFCWSRWASSCARCTAPRTYFTFEDTLTQIGLGYLPVPAGLPQAALAMDRAGGDPGGLLAGMGALPRARPRIQLASRGRAGRLAHFYRGFAAHWNKNANFGNAFDQWFLNLFPRTHPFVFNDGGYLTLSFIPTLGTMILGLVAGRWLRASAPTHPMRAPAVAGVIGVAAGLLLHFTGICPIVKRIWTPSWTLFSGGICFLFTAGFSWVIDVKGYRKWAFPLVVIGMNSIAAYLIAHLFERFVFSSFRIHLGPDFFKFLGPGLEPFLLGSAVLFSYWLILYWMYQRKLFLKI